MADLAHPPRSLIPVEPQRLRAIEREVAPEVKEPRGGPHWRSLTLLTPLAMFLGIMVIGMVLPLPSPDAQSLANRLAPPVLLGGDWRHPLGTDGLGRDVLTRITAGAVTSLQVSLIAASLSALIGIACGVVSGMVGGWLDHALTLISEVTMTVPGVVVGVVLTATLGQSLRNLVTILVIGGWIGYARVLRLETRQLRTADFLLAATVTGGSRWHIAWRHLTPNLLPTILVLYCQQLGGMMLWEASLTYLGLGARVDTITLGGTVRDGQAQIFSGWWIGVAAGSMIALAIVGFAFAGDWLRDRLDRGERSDMQ